MGMDMVEVIMEVEDTFDIHIDDSNETKLKTVASLYALILKHQGVQQGNVCLSSAVCFRLRRVVMKHIEIPRKRFRVDSSLHDLIPVSGRKRTWNAIGMETGWRLPDLERSRSVVWVLALGWAATVLPLGILLRDQIFWVGFVLIFMASILYAIIATLATAPLAVHFPVSCRSVRESVIRIVNTNYGKLTEEFRCANPDETWKILKAIIVEQLRVPPEKVTPEARFVEDLNCG